MRCISRRSFLEATAALSLGGVLSACSGDSSSTTTTTSTSQASGADEVVVDPDPVTLTYWSIHRATEDFTREVIASFQEEYPYITVDMTLQSENYEQNVELAFTSKQSPDLICIVTNAKYMHDQNYALPLNDYITPELEEMLGDALLVPYVNSYDGNIYSLGTCGINYRLIYNKDMFAAAGIENPPETVEELVETAKILTETLSDEGKYGFALQLKCPNIGLARSADLMASRSGKYRFDYTTGLFDFDGYEPIIDALGEMYQNGYTLPGCEGLDTDPMRSQFAAGNIGMYMSGNWEYAVLTSQFPAECEWDTAPIPYCEATGPAGRTAITHSSTSFCISSQTEHPYESWLFLQYYMSKENQIAYAEVGGGFPIVEAIASEVDYSKVPGSEKFMLDDSLDVVLPPVPLAAGLTIEGSTYYSEFAAAIYGQQTAAEAIAISNERYNTALIDAVASGEVPDLTNLDFEPLLVD